MFMSCQPPTLFHPTSSSPACKALPRLMHCTPCSLLLVLLPLLLLLLLLPPPLLLPYHGLFC